MTQSIFNYQTLKVRVQKNTKTLFIKFHNDLDNNPITMETLFELETLLGWCTTHIEIHTLFFESSSDMFSVGYNQNILKKLTIDHLSNFTKKLQKINQALMLLPQTVIIDLKMGANNIACELATACDIRIANRACKIKFNHAKLGLVPCSGGVVQLSEVVGHGRAKNWLLTGSTINFSKLEQSGYIFNSYTMDTRDEVVNQLLMDIHEQLPVQRIQTKLAVIENIREKVEDKLTMEKQIAKAAMITEDWRNENQETPMKSKNMKTAVKLSLIKSENNNELPN